MYGIERKEEKENHKEIIKEIIINEGSGDEEYSPQTIIQNRKRQGQRVLIGG